MKSQIDSIFYILGNKTRRDILSILSDEPMYFNQVSNQIGIGQQAMLRHMQALVDTGIVSTYDEKSELGAPNRKYYHLDSSFNLSISLSEDEFSIEFNGEKKSDKTPEKFFDKKFGHISRDPSLSLEALRNNLTEIDREIEDLQTEINNLRTMRQLLLQKVHKIGKENFVLLERKILYKMMREGTSSLTELSEMMGEKKSEVRNAIKGLQSKIDKGKMKTLVNDFDM